MTFERCRDFLHSFCLCHTLATYLLFEYHPRPAPKAAHGTSKEMSLLDGNIGRPEEGQEDVIEADGVGHGSLADATEDSGEVRLSAGKVSFVICTLLNIV